MAYRDRLRPRFRRPMPAAFKRLSDRFRWFGMDQTGSVLAAGVVVLGIFAVLFAAGVQREGAAQELDIFTAHRRKALDVARGGIDKLLMEFKQRDQISDCNTDLVSNDEENWVLKPDVTSLGSDMVLLTSKATVSGVSETVKVTLEKQQYGNALEDFLGGITLASRNDIKGTFIFSLPPDIEEPVYYGVDEMSLRYGSRPVHLEKINEPILIPGLNDVEQAVWAQLPDRSSFRETSSLPRNGFWDPDTVIDENTWIKTKNGTGTVNLHSAGASLTVNEGKWLVIEGSLEISPIILFTQTVVLEGNILVIGGSVKIGGLGTTRIKGSGMILNLPSSKSKGVTIKQIGVADLRGLTVITTGQLEIGSIFSFKRGLLAYGNRVKLTGLVSKLELETCCLVSNTDIEVDMAISFGLTLHKGEKKDWSNQPLLTGVSAGGGSYSIVGWEEGNS